MSEQLGTNPSEIRHEPDDLLPASATEVDPNVDPAVSAFKTIPEREAVEEEQKVEEDGKSESSVE